jgi:hypothetical protein
MQDIRKPYSRSKSNRDLPSRVEAFEKNSYPEEEESFDDEPVHIPVRKSFRERRSIDQMEMYPARGRRAYDTEETVRAGRRSDDGIVYRDPRTRYVSRRQSLGTLAFIASIVVLAGGAALLTFVFNRATVTIVPKHEDVADFRQTITFAAEGADTSDSVLFIVSTSSLTRSKTLALSETKKVEAKASGNIIIYNNYSSESQRLIKNTRFESSAGKIYRINQSVTVPGKSGNTPGSVEVTVYADSFGSDYNSAPTDFTIPGFKGSPQYTAFYARSKGPLSGGASGNASMASLADLNAAKDELALKIAQEMKASLSKVNEKEYVGLYSAIDIVYADNEQEVLRGDTSTYEVTATGYLMLAKEEELAKSVAQSLREYDGSPVRLDYADKLAYTRKDADSVATSQRLDILVEGQPRVVFVTDEENLKRMVVGKKRSEFTTLMESIPSIEGAEISFSPLWLSTFPEDEDKISIVESLPKR